MFFMTNLFSSNLFMCSALMKCAYTYNVRNPLNGGKLMCSIYTDTYDALLSLCELSFTIR